ncbi:hypothetical protein LIER_02636 [Lithospermum erythrorhizon]|uniref:DUF7792 domain-containing protein n=1 Tax=Lithospermum erythrorhizon TaxID=34254 RepID=A0AAV3NUU6_LITER
MADIVKQILTRPIQLADQVVKQADDTNYFKQDCLEIKGKCERLVGLLRVAARASSDLYERPTRRIIDDTEQVLDKALTLIFKCKVNGIRRVFTIINAASFRKISLQLENSIGDVSWLLNVSTPAVDRDDEYLGLPPIAANEPILCLIWEQIAILSCGSLEERSDAAASLVSLARDNDRYGKLIIEEGGVVPLLKLAKEGKMEGQENAARAIGLLGRDPESVEQIVNGGVCTVFAKVLKEGHMKVQIVVAWAVSELAAHHPKCQDHFAQNNTIRLLVSHLAFETIEEHSKYTIPSKQNMSIHTVVMANSSNTSSNNNGMGYDKDVHRQMHHTMGNQTSAQIHNVVANTMAMKNPDDFSEGNNNTQLQANNSNKHSQRSDHNSNQQQHPHHPHHQNPKNSHHHALLGTSIKGRQYEDPATKAQMKAMAARALRFLCAGNLSICKNITESRALLCLSVLLEKGEEDVQYHSALTLMEITVVAEQNAELRRSAFKPTAQVAKAVVEQFLKIIEQADSELLIPSITSIGNLSRTFRATETRIITPLVKLLDDREPEIMNEAVLALNKFTCPDNFLHESHSKTFIDEGGVKHLVPLVYFGEQLVQIPSLVLLCYIAISLPDNEALAQEQVLNVLEWATKQSHLMQVPIVEELISEAKKRLDLFQSRAPMGYH